MSDEQWRMFFLSCSRVLRANAASTSWCAWTTFEQLRTSMHYWTSHLPAEHELGQTGTLDGGTWGQPFLYKGLAHLVVPRQFHWESRSSSSFDHGTVEQPIEQLSQELAAAGIPHRASALVLEIKLY